MNYYYHFNLKTFFFDDYDDGKIVQVIFIEYFLFRFCYRLFRPSQQQQKKIIISNTEGNMSKIYFSPLDFDFVRVDVLFDFGATIKSEKFPLLIEIENDENKLLFTQPDHEPRQNDKKMIMIHFLFFFLFKSIR